MRKTKVAKRSPKKRAFKKDEHRDQILAGDCEHVLSGLPAGLVNTVVTSPPYYQQRHYSAKTEVGQEATPELYVQRMVSIFAEARRVLHDEGTLWLVIGDKYKNGSLLGMPWRVALALQDDGWNLRSDIIWHKPNAMPSSVKTRPTTDHEYVFLFSKSKQYYYDVDAIREPHVTFSEKSKMKGGRNHFFKKEARRKKAKTAAM